MELLESRLHGVSGETVPVAETVESFEAIVNGELDETPEQAFLNVGGVEQVQAKAKALQESVASGRAADAIERQKQASDLTALRQGELLPEHALSSS